jgi:hypothetical protein
VNVLVDITERKRADEELERRVEERTAELAETNEELRRHIGERRALETRLEHEVSHDHLTDLSNQASFHENLARPGTCETPGRQGGVAVHGLGQLQAHK